MNDERSVTSFNSYKPDHPYKMCQRIWSAYTKYIRQQCRKERQVDSFYFGSFIKKNSEDEDETIQYKQLVDINNHFSNLKSISKQDEAPLAKELVQVNF